MKKLIVTKRSAFTLIEILVALSIVVLIMSVLYGSYRATTTSISHYQPRNIVEQQARLFLQRFTSELRCSYAGTVNKSDERMSGNRFTQNILQQEDSPLFVSEQISRGKVFLQFATSSFTSSPYENLGGLAIVSYKLDKSGTVLLRSVRKYIERNEKENTDYQWFPVLSDVKKITCEYLDDEKWQNDWKSKESKVLPNAVRISLTLYNGETGPVTFESCADIMCGKFQNSEPGVQTNIAAFNL